jgi:hypothetical protein
MRDRGATEKNGDHTVASRRTVSEGAMFGSAVGRKRRVLWAILSLLFALGFVVSAIMVRSEQSKALDSVVERGRDEAQLATATFTGKQLTKPITGSSYDRAAAKIWKSVTSKGSIAGVTIWSSHGRVLFSLNESRVGNTPAEMRSLITGIADGSDTTRVLDGNVQTFTKIKVPGGPVVVVEVDQPFALVEAQTGDLWSMVRLGSAIGLALCLVLLGLTFVSSKARVRARENAEPPRLDERHEADEDVETKAERRQPVEQPPAEKRVPTYAELFGPESDLDEEIPDGAPEDGDRPGEEEAVMEAEVQPSAEQVRPAEPMAAEQPAAEQSPVEPLPSEEPGPAAEEAVSAPHADLDEAMDQVEALDADGKSEESIESHWPEEFRDVFQDMARGGDAQTQEMRQRREEFKNRAKQAELRLKKQDAELDEAPSAPSSER